MRHLSRRSSGYVFLYVAIASIVTQTALGLAMMGVYRFSENFSYTLALFLSKLIIFLPPLIMVAVRKRPVAQMLRLKTFQVKYAGYAIGIGLFSFLFIHLFNSFVSNLTGMILYQMEPDYFSSAAHSLWPYILTSCLIPALLEVTTFQGVVQSGLHDAKPLKACLIVGLLYGLMVVGSNVLIGTLDILGYVLYGFVLSYIALQSGSIFPAMIAALVYYLFGYGDFEDMLYRYCLSPLGVSQFAAAIGLLILAGGIGALLMVKMPRSRDTGRPLRLPHLPSFREFRQRLTQPYIPAPEEKTPEAAVETVKAPESSEIIAQPQEAVNDPGDTAKNKNAGFIVGGSILAALWAASLVWGVIMIITQYSNMIY